MSQRQQYVTHQSLLGLKLAVDELLRQGWELQGTPFFDKGSQRNVQVIIKTDAPLPPGEMRLKEPKRR